MTTPNKQDNGVTNARETVAKAFNVTKEENDKQNQEYADKCIATYNKIVDACIGILKTLPNDYHTCLKWNASLTEDMTTCLKFINPIVSICLFDYMGEFTFQISRNNLSYPGVSFEHSFKMLQCYYEHTKALINSLTQHECPYITETNYQKDYKRALEMSKAGQQGYTLCSF